MTQHFKFAANIIVSTSHFRSFSTLAIEPLVFRLQNNREDSRTRYKGKITA